MSLEGSGNQQKHPVRDVGMTSLSPELAATLGSEEAEIVTAICQGFGDLESIHFITGIPIPCIERKLGALIAMGLVMKERGDYKPGGTAASTPRYRRRRGTWSKWLQQLPRS